MSLRKLLKEITSSDDYKYRVYKKSEYEYRVEEKSGGSWNEIERDRSIKEILLFDCEMVVEESGRRETIEKTGQDSADVPVHAWVQCNSYEIDTTLDSYDGRLYYNPYAVKYFVDRDSFERETPEIIERCEYVSTEDNHMVYKNATEKRRDNNVADNNMDILRQEKLKQLQVLAESYFYS